MLRGRESLIRLIGKRRRFLPNRLSLLSSPIESSLSLNLCSDKDLNSVSIENKHQDGDIESSRSSGSGKYVTCPVCSSRVNGEDSIINSHLDACLSRGRGSKRKLTQSTLLQLNFYSRSKVEHQSCVLRQKNGSSVDPDSGSMPNTVHGLPENASNIDTNNILCESLADPVMQPQSDCPFKTPINNETNGAAKICSPKKEGTTSGMVTTKDDISGMFLETFIVGRKFSEEKELSLGVSFSLERDPTNVKDSNAIKVISADPGCCKVLGFIPRELAMFLSPLIEKYCLSFKGFVTTTPRSCLDVVPIEIMCDSIKSFQENKYDVEEFKSLWTSIQQAIDSMKSSTPNALKYQKNFCLLVQEVLQGYPHLLSDDEKHFLHLFGSLSDDSQRLFIRLYMRKVAAFGNNILSSV